MKYENKTLSLVVDMYGCPNRCKHCWITPMPNGHMKDEEAEALVNYFKPYFGTIEYYSWAREPDYCDDYRERWEKDNQLSINIKPERFELASFWRIVRDPSYVSFLKEVGVKVVQLSFFGLEEKTDYYVGRKNAFKELLEATEILIQNEIAPRWQCFINEDNKDEIVSVLELSKTLKLKERCAKFNQEFKLFVHAGDALGNNHKLYDIRICKDSIDSRLIPYYLDFEGNYTEASLYEKFKDSEETMRFNVEDHIVLYVLLDGSIYYNFGAIEKPWAIGNLKYDKKEELIEKIVSNDANALHVAHKTPMKVLVKQYGDPSSMRMFTEDDYKMYLLNKHLYTIL